MKWLNNLEALAETGRVGVCPYCGSEDTDYCYTIAEPSGRMGYGDLWCNACKRGFHISRAKVPDNAKIGKPPKNIIY